MEEASHLVAFESLQSCPISSSLSASCVQLTCDPSASCSGHLLP